MRNMVRPLGLVPVLIGASLLAAGAVGTGPAGEWPQWRGPNRDDVSTETGLLKQWPAGGPTLAWKATGLGAGFSGPAISGGKIYLMGDPDGSCQLIALDAASGKRLWATVIGKGGEREGMAGPAGTPSVSGGLVFGLSLFGDLACVQATTGQIVWHKSVEADLGGRMPGRGWAESPLVDGDRLLLTPGGPQGAVVALNKATGAVIWYSKELMDGAHYSSIIIAEIGGVRQYIQITAKSVAGLADKDGRLLWRAMLPDNPAIARVATPIYADGQVFVSCGYGNDGAGAYKITAAGGQFKTEQVYKGPNLATHHGGVVLVGGHLYGHSNMTDGWECMDFATHKIMWKDKSVGKGSLTCADGHLYIRGEKGAVALVEPTPTGYKEISRFEQPNRSKKDTFSHPVVCGGKLYLRDQDVLLCYDIKAP